MQFTSHLPWQSPNRTEWHAAETHKDAHINYLAIPWASYIDSNKAWNPAASPARNEASRESRLLHTVCQHVYWDEAAAWWTMAGITDVWLSHAAESGVRPGKTSSVASDLQYPWRIHAWPLYAVNIQHPRRRTGLRFGKEPRRKKYLASFVGAHMQHYVSETRLRLRALEKHPAFYIRITGEQWHLDPQPLTTGAPLAQQPSHDAREYNTVLSDSVFALCPAGAGRNSIRIWEALAVGAIPVLIDPPPKWPTFQHAPHVDWNTAVVQISPQEVNNLPLLLRNIPYSEIHRRQQLCMSLYEIARSARCYDTNTVMPHCECPNS